MRAVITSVVVNAFLLSRVTLDEFMSRSLYCTYMYVYLSLAYVMVFIIYLRFDGAHRSDNQERSSVRILRR